MDSSHRPRLSQILTSFDSASMASFRTVGGYKMLKNITEGFWLISANLIIEGFIPQNKWKHSERIPDKICTDRKGYPRYKRGFFLIIQVRRDAKEKNSVFESTLVEKKKLFLVKFWNLILKIPQVQQKWSFSLHLGKISCGGRTIWKNDTKTFLWSIWVLFSTQPKKPSIKYYKIIIFNNCLQ